MADCNSGINEVPSNCEFGVKVSCVGIQSLPQALPTTISSDNILFAFDGLGNCTSSDTQTLTSALLWIENNAIDVLQPCQIASAPDCTGLVVENGKLVPKSIMQMLECLPWTQQGQTILYTGSSVILGQPIDTQTYSWLNLSDTTTSTGVLSYTDFAGGVPVVNDAETALVLQPCLPVTSICPGNEDEVLTTITDPATNELAVVWQPIPNTDVTWLSLSDTFTGSGDETTYTGTAGYIPIVNPGETGLLLSECLPVSSICPGTENQIIQTVLQPDGVTLVPEWVDCLPENNICPGTDGQLLISTTQPDGTVIPVWSDCLLQSSICPGTDGQILISRDDGAGNAIPTWEDNTFPTSWLELPDTFTNTGDETSYAGTAGYIVRVNPAETGVQLESCLPESSICPGTDNQIIQTLDDGAGNLVPQWVDCLPIAQLCPGADGQVIEMVDDGAGNLTPTWVNVADSTWLGLTDTLSGNIPESYANTAGLVPVVNNAETDLVLSCVPASSICPGNDQQVIQSVLQPDGATITPEWVDCLDPSLVCPGADGEVLTTIDDGTGNLVTSWQPATAGVTTWLGLTDTFTATGDETTYANTAGFVPISDGANGLTLGCLPAASICPGTDTQILQTLDNAGTLTPTWIDCLPVAQICPADDDCARLVSRNGAVQWVYDGAANLCDFYGQNDPNNNTIAEADIAAYYQGWEGATIRIREEGDGIEFVTQNDGVTAPAQGQVLIHDFDDNGVLQTHYYTPIEFSVTQTDPGEEIFLPPGRSELPIMNPVTQGNTGVESGLGTVIIDPTATDPNNARGRAGYVITKNGRYNVCLKANIEVELLGNPQPVGTAISVSPAIVIDQAVGGAQEYRVSEVSLNVGQDHVDVGHIYTHSGSGCVAATLSAGDVIQVRALVNPVRNVATYTQDPVNGDGLLVTWGSNGAPAFSISEIPGYDPALV